MTEALIQIETMGSAFKTAGRRFALKAGVAALTFAALSWANTPASAQALRPTLSYASTSYAAPGAGLEGMTPEANSAVETGAASALPEHLQRRIVSYQTRAPAGSIVVDTANTYLYYVLGDGRAIRYGIGVGREGFTWSGQKTISRKAEWPDWVPPADMIARQPYLPRWVGGGPGNPLGARALYLGSSMYRIHGTNDPSTIGKFVSSGCIRMTNDDVIDLFSRVGVGTAVLVLPKTHNARDVRPSTTQNRPLSLGMNLPTNAADQASTRSSRL